MIISNAMDTVTEKTEKEREREKRKDGRQSKKLKGKVEVKNRGGKIVHKNSP